MRLSGFFFLALLAGTLVGGATFFSSGYHEAFASRPEFAPYFQALFIATAFIAPAFFVVGGMSAARFVKAHGVATSLMGVMVFTFGAVAMAYHQAWI